MDQVGAMLEGPLCVGLVGFDGEARRPTKHHVGIDDLVHPITAIDYGNGNMIPSAKPECAAWVIMTNPWVLCPEHRSHWQMLPDVR